VLSERKNAARTDRAGKKSQTAVKGLAGRAGKNVLQVFVRTSICLLNAK
jgi:hypothetical protein